MAITVTSALLSAANAAASSASEGSKNAAFCAAIASGIGSGYKIVARRDGEVVLDLTMSGSMTSSAYGLTIPNAYSVRNTLESADIDSGTWTIRFEKASDPAVYLQGTLGPAGSAADLYLSADLDSTLDIALSGIVLRSPQIDSASSLSLALLQGDVNTGLQHEYLLHGVNPSWSWGTYPRSGKGANPPNASGWSSPVWVPWGVVATDRNNAPGSHNWRVAIHSIHHFAQTGGTWATTGTQATTPDQISGAMYTNYETNANTPADRRTSNGYVEVKFPNAGGSYHFYTSFRTAVPTSGVQHRAVLIKASLTLDNPAGTDDRSSARVALLAGGDYWKSNSTQWSASEYTNDDFWIGRARRPVLGADTGVHFAGTMTSESDFNSFIAYVNGLGIL